jgi:hypothetical protein
MEAIVRVGIYNRAVGDVWKENNGAHGMWFCTLVPYFSKGKWRIGKSGPLGKHVAHTISQKVKEAASWEDAYNFILAYHPHAVGQTKKQNSKETIDI